MLGIVDYDAGNTANVVKACTYLGIDTVLSADKTVLAATDGLILPGVGAFRAAMNELNRRDLVGFLQASAANGKPLIGICLGMQLLFASSTEFGTTAGLNILPGTVTAIPVQDGLKVPHMGWNINQAVRNNEFGQVFAQQATYFVHSYYVQTAARNIVATTDYGVQIPSVVQSGNVVGMQFHPEKSGRVGLSGLQVFANMAAEED